MEEEPIAVNISAFYSLPLLHALHPGPIPFCFYQGKLVGDPTVRWQFGSEAQGGKHLIAVIVLDDFSYCLQGHGVGIQLVGTHVVE